MQTNTNTPSLAGTTSTGDRSALQAVTLTLAFAMALLPILLLSIYCYQIASQSVRDIVQAENVSLTGNLSLLLQQEMNKTTALTEAFAGTPGTVSALSQNDELVMTTRLKALTLSFPAIERVMMTGTDTSLKSVYPADGQSPLSAVARRAVTETVAGGKPTISGVYANETGIPVIAVTAPVRESGAVIGAVVLEYRAAQIRKWLQNIDVPAGGSLFLLDADGVVVAHPDMGSGSNMNIYKAEKPVLAGLGGTLQTTEFNDPVLARRMVATFLPMGVGRRTWLIVAEKPTESAYRDLDRVKRNIGLAGGMLTLLTLGMILALGRLSRRNLRLNRELHEKNLRLRETDSIVRSSNDAIVGFLRDGRIRQWNTAAEKMYGWNESEIARQSVGVLVPPARRDEFAGLLAKVTAGETIQNFETVRLKHDGTTIPVSVTLSPIRSDAGGIIAVSSIDRDITERKKIEQMKDDFISFVSHQLKAPVTAIRWTLEMLLAGDYGQLPADVRKPLENVSVVNAQNYNLISDILNVSRIDRGVIAVDMKPLPLREIAERALRDYRLAIRKAGLTLAVKGETPEIMVNVDKEKMAEAVTNSISNAIKHTKTGGITVTMYAQEGFGCIDVADTGEGMSDAMMKKLFTRDQVLGGGATAEKSAGLGLYIAKHFMEIQGGTMGVASTEGKGTVFTYRIPLAGTNL